MKFSAVMLYTDKKLMKTIEYIILRSHTLLIGYNKP
jgi:hypothetical protein